MATKDVPQAVKTALEASWLPPTVEHPEYEGKRPGWTPTLHVDESYRAEPDHPTLLVADDGGVPVFNDPWLIHKIQDGKSFRVDLRRITLRLTAFAKGRSEARSTVETAVDWIIANKSTITETYDNVEKPVIARIESVGDPLLTRDPDTGNFLGSVIMIVMVRPVPVDVSP